MNSTRNIETVVAAIAFDKFSENVIASAQTLCQQTGASLHLVHVCEPDASLAYFMPYYDDGKFADAGQRHLDRASQAAEKRLRELSRSVDGRVKTSHAIVQGIPSEALEQETSHVGGSLIILGVGLSQMRFLPRGWSTALTLMAESNHAVMLVDKEASLNFAKTGINLLMTDDLQSDSGGLCQFTASLACALKAEKLHHLHVTGFQKDTLAAALDSAFAAGHVATSKSLDPEEVLEVIQSKISEKLQTRMKPYAAKLKESGVIYDAIIGAGDPRETINDHAQSLLATALIYGRHKTVHRRPFSIGQVPFSAMVGQKIPVIVVPS